MEIMDKVHFFNYISPGIPERRIQTFHDAAAQIDVQISYDKTCTAILERQNTRPDYLPSAVWRAEKLLQQHYDLDYSTYIADIRSQCTTFGLCLSSYPFQFPPALDTSTGEASKFQVRQQSETEKRVQKVLLLLRWLLCPQCHMLNQVSASGVAHV